MDHTCCCPSSILYFLYSPNQGCDPFQEYMPSIFNTVPLSFCFLIKYSELHISLFPAALATSTDFWHIVLPLPSSQTVLKIPSCFCFLFLPKHKSMYLSVFILPVVIIQFRQDWSSIFPCLSIELGSTVRLL